MNVRIIAGKYGGRIIPAPPGRRTHPMSERVRNALFNKLGDSVHDAVVLDAFAGTGAIGFEALSRGAKSVVFVETNRVAQKMIQQSMGLLRTGDEAKLVRARVASWCGTQEPESFDIIFVDPPYHEAEWHFSTVERLFGLLKPGALMVLSTPGTCEVPHSNGIVVVDNRSYANATLTYYRKK